MSYTVGLDLTLDEDQVNQLLVMMNFTKPRKKFSARISKDKVQYAIILTGWELCKVMIFTTENGVEIESKAEPSHLVCLGSDRITSLGSIKGQENVQP